MLLFTLYSLALYLGIPGVQGAAKYQPGDTMRAVDYETVDSALDDVLKAGGVGKGGRWVSRGSITDPMCGESLYSSHRELVVPQK